MAYMSQEKKADILNKMKVALKGTGLKFSLGVRHDSTLVMKIQQGPVDFIANYNETVSQAHRFGQRVQVQPAANHLDVNAYYYKEQFTGSALEVLHTIIPILMDGNWDQSDSQSDYFNVGWYIELAIGTWEKPYVLTTAPVESLATARRMVHACEAQLSALEAAS